MSEPGPGAGRADLVGRILGYMDRPWKVAAVATLAILGGAGWLIWTERARLAEAFLPAHHGFVLASPDALDAGARRLVGVEGTALALIWGFDIQGNAARFLAGVNRDGSPWRPADVGLPARLPAIIASTEAGYIVDILRGEPICAEATAGKGLLFERLAGEGVHRFCVVPVPPVRGHVLAVILIAWRDPPDSRIEAAAVEGAVEVAATLARQ